LYPNTKSRDFQNGVPITEQWVSRVGAGPMHKMWDDGDRKSIVFISFLKHYKHVPVLLQNQTRSYSQCEPYS